MRLTHSGNVGIGTSSPSQLLHLYTNLATSSGVGTALQITSDGAGGDNAWIGVNKGTGNGLEFSVENRDIIFNTSATTPFGGSERMRITAGGNVLIGTTTDIGQRLQVSGGYIAQVDGGVRTFLGYDGTGSLIGTTTNHYFRFITNDIERMRITSGGNVGIGTSSPATYSLAPNLVVDSGANSGGLTIKTGNTASTSNYGFIGFADGTSGSEQYRGFIQYSHNFNTFSDCLLFGTSGTEQMRITSGGNVLIGTTTAQSGTKLQVAGVMDVWSSSNTLLRFNHDGTRGLIETFTGGGYSPTAINPNGGNVLIGTTTGDAGTPYWSVGRPASSGNFSISSYALTAMTIQPTTGNVGIGTTNPTPHSGSNALIIQGGGGGRAIMELHDSSAGGKAVFQQVAGTTYIGSLAKGGGGGDLILLSNGTGTSAAESVYVKANGNVLIGTSTDVGATLHVNGTIRTGAPSGGSAVNWRLGTARGGTVTTNATVRVEIDGVLVDLVARYV